MTEKCPICRSDISKPEPYVLNNKDHGYIYNCLRCGEYQLDSFAEVQLKNILDSDQKIAVLSHWIKTRYEANPSEAIYLTDDLVENIVKQPPPTPDEQAKKFVLWLGNSKSPPGELVGVQATTHQSIMGAMTPNGFEYVIIHLINEGILQGDNHGFARASICLSFKGWEYYEKLKRGVTDSRKAFMAMEYGIEKLDKIYQTFKDAVGKTGFELVRLDKISKAGLIDDHLRVEIRTSRFLISDLTNGNPGAYWEAGYAEGLGKSVIYTCDKKVFDNPDTKPHFDTNHHLTILWDEKNPQEAAKQLKDTIRATLPDAAKLTDD